MKTVKMMAVLAALLMLLPAFVSCDKDDDKDEPNPVDISSIVGTYSGSLGWKVMTTEGNFNETYDLLISEDKTDSDDVIVTLPQCTFTPPIENARPFTIPALEVHDVDVVKAGDAYNLSEDDFEITIEGKKYTGRINGTVKGKNVEVAYTVTPATMPMPINFTFTGTIK